MKVLVTYFSRTGQTEKVAKAIYEAIDAEKDIKKLDEIEALEGYDLYFVGFPLEQMGPSNEMEAWLKEHTPGKKIAAFITHGAPVGAPPLQAWIADCKESMTEAEIVGVFDCQGEMSEQLITMLANSDNPQARGFAAGAASAKGQPDAAALEKAAAFAKDVMATVC